MKTHTNDFKNKIKEFGKQIDAKITYQLDGETIELGAESLNSITPHYEASILKSVMKQLDIDSNTEIPVGTELNFKFGLKIRSGKNLCGLSNETTTFNNVVITIEDGEITLNGTANATGTFYISPIEETILNGDYVNNIIYVSGSKTGSSNFNLRKASDSSVVSGTQATLSTTNTNKKFSINEDTSIKFGVYITSGSTFTNYKIKPQIVVGTEEDYDYELFGSYEYLDFGNYIVKEIEKQEDTNSWKITCYDKMLYTMIPYEKMNITYPITIKEYISAICEHLNLDFANSIGTFANYDKEIQHELYLSYTDATHDYTEDMGYTFRDVLDEIAQATASTIVINDDDKLEIRYITDTQDTINEEYLKDVNVNFGEKYGPVNSIVLSRAGGSDKVYLKDDESIAENGLCEINISENQIMNFNDRSTYLPDILNQLDGLQYYLNDFSSTGITYYDVCDKYNVQIGENTYPCVMFNDEINITQGLEEFVYTEMPEQGETDYTKADKTDRKINQTYIIVDKQNQIIQSVVSTVDEQNDKISQITQTVDQIESQISDIPTITTENEGTGSLYLNNLMNMKLISLRIHPTDRDILGLFATPLLKASTTLKSLSRGITFDNTNESKEDLYYKLPDNLYYYDSETYDEFFYDGKEERIYVIRKVEVDEYGNKSILDTPITEEYEYQDLIVEEGNYYVFMSTYPTAYIYVKAMIKNDYTDMFATSYEVDSKITQTADTINLEVSNKVDNEDYNGANIMLKINSDESQAKINADKVDIEADDVLNILAGNTINMTSKNLKIYSTNFQVNENGDMIANNGTFNGNITAGSKISLIDTGDSSDLASFEINSNNVTNVLHSTSIKIGDNLQTPRNNIHELKYIGFNPDNDGYPRSSFFQCRKYDLIQRQGSYFETNQAGLEINIGQNSGATFSFDTGDGAYLSIRDDDIYVSSEPITPSDERLKQEIKDIDTSWIDELKVKEFEYIKSPDKKQIGLIAQDYENKEYNKYFLNKNDDGYYGIAYGNITNALIQYCQEMKKEINSLKEEIKKLKESDK